MATHASLAHSDHRPWPLPASPWVGRQSWRDLLFVHWPLPVAAVRGLVPRGLEIDTFEGQTWIGVVPFRMAGVMVRGLPDLPWISAFPELNLRLYVTRDRKPGVWFLSLDATNWLAVWGARRFFHLPYEHAAITVEDNAGTIHYQSKRRSSPAAFGATYAPVSPPYLAMPGSLEHWLTERYCLYAQDLRGRILRCEVHHEAWPLQHAEATIHHNDLLAPHDIPQPRSEPLLHYADRLDVIVWAPVRVG